MCQQPLADANGVWSGEIKRPVLNVVARARKRTNTALEQDGRDGGKRNLGGALLSEVVLVYQ